MRIPKIFFYAILGVVAAFWFGYVGPVMVSAESDALVLGWILTTLAGAVFITHRFIRRKK